VRGNCLGPGAGDCEHRQAARERPLRVRGGCADELRVRLKLGDGEPGSDVEQAVLRRVGALTPVHSAHRDGECLRLAVQPAEPAVLEREILGAAPGAEVFSIGARLELMKQVGSPDALERQFHVAEMAGTHAIGHTRLSTESRVDISHSQPFWAHGVPDLATVHNGHITNYHKLRRRFEQDGYRFYTENDSEVIGVYLRDRMAAGRTLEGALHSSLEDFDGAFCYLAASKDCLGFVKDRFGFKPLMVAETDDFVAIATEEIALRQALGELPFIAEDLGFITPAVHALRDRLQIPGMRVMQFGFGDPGAHIYLPHRFPTNTVVYSGTHDNDTTLGWWRSGATPQEKEAAAAYFFGDQGAQKIPEPEIPWAFVRAAAHSVANLCVIPLQDILGLGSEARMNVPRG